MAAFVKSSMSAFGQAEETAAVRPTKLFIGGISRNTTTKLLRDHFARYGRVLDCVAMREPDGRSRGFGLVTLDCLAAAERCLAEPMVIDGRVLDMKMAVPESKSYGNARGGKSSGKGYHAEVYQEQSPSFARPAALSAGAPEFVPVSATPKQALSATASEFVPLVAKTAPSPVQAPAVSARADEDLLVYAEDYVAFLEDQQRICNMKKKASVFDGKSPVSKPAPHCPPPAQAPPPPPVSVEKCSCVEESEESGNDLSTCVSSNCLKVSPAASSNGDLPSKGSELHATGQCRPCNFFSKGRCANELDCTFCHFTHEKRKPTRQELRDRRQAWQAKQEASQQETSEETATVLVAALTNIELPARAVESPAPATKKYEPASPAIASPSKCAPKTFAQPAALPFAPAALAFNFADYSDDEDDSDDDDEETMPEEVRSPTTADATEEAKGGCQWSREEMLRLRVAMGNAHSPMRLPATKVC